MRDESLLLGALFFEQLALLNDLFPVVGPHWLMLLLSLDFGRLEVVDLASLVLVTID